MTGEIVQVRKMLDALLKSEGLTEWVGGYVYGATSNGDPFVVLYPAAEHLKEKVCRVYPHQFKKLPAFINTDNIAGDTDGNPSKDKAQRAGIYHECLPFKIVMHLGRETQMGREKRFSDVLYVPERRMVADPPLPSQNGSMANVEDIRAKLEEETSWPLGQLANMVAATGRFDDGSAALEALRMYPFSDKQQAALMSGDFELKATQKVSRDFALSAFDWLTKEETNP